MEKTKSESIKDFLVRKVATTLEKDEKVCAKVIEWVYKESLSKIKEVQSVEISGFGSFVLYPTKIQKKIDKKEDMIDHLSKRLKEDDLLPQVRKRFEDSLVYTEKYLKFLKEKKEYHEQNSGIPKDDGEGDTKP